jgi:NitT/TauT family transport system substrate-binding protein/putative hydroxymethylpyrimidine transport system substrate-binding protein
MARVAASLAAVALALGLAACDGDGAEPGASDEATLVLDFVPNAAHAGIYSAVEEGYLAEAGVALEIRAPAASTDAPKLLEAGRVEFAVLDVHDLTLAIHRGADIGAVTPIVAGPLASVIAGDRDEILRPRELEGRTVGVTGLPSDDAVLDTVVEADGGEPAAVDRVTIGFDSVAALAAGRVDAATAFWNAEGVNLRELGVPTREFRAGDFGAPDFPELWLATSRELAAGEPRLIQRVADALLRGNELVADDPVTGVENLLAGAEGTDEAAQRAQMEALAAAGAFDRAPVPGSAVRDLIDWELRNGILPEPIATAEFFAGQTG